MVRFQKLKQVYYIQLTVFEYPKLTMAKNKKDRKKEPTRVDINRFNEKIDSFEKEMDEVRRDFIQKSANSKKRASELVLTS